MNYQEAKEILKRHDSDEPCGCEDRNHFNRCSYESAHGFIEGWESRGKEIEANYQERCRLQAEINKYEEEIDSLRSSAEKLVEAATGLSYGTDWNNGTHAKLHGYRQKLLEALAAYREQSEHRQSEEKK